mmetsp:Transcript_8087/g.34032  ORF Transcript_8087/g.34032 Transcript_8087/m.34032 type:complete len:209 (-) Transcript_8087:292-918(-)
MDSLAVLGLLHAVLGHPPRPDCAPDRLYENELATPLQRLPPQPLLLISLPLCFHLHLVELFVKVVVRARQVVVAQCLCHQRGTRVPHHPLGAGRVCDEVPHRGVHRVVHPIHQLVLERRTELRHDLSCRDILGLDDGLVEPGSRPSLPEAGEGTHAAGELLAGPRCSVALPRRDNVVLLRSLCSFAVDERGDVVDRNHGELITFLLLF